MRKILSFVAAMLITLTVSATTTNVTSGVNTLRTAVAAASAGDVLELGDGIYYEEGNFDMKINLTIKAAEGAKPVIANRYYFRVEGGADITFQGLKFDGAGWRSGEDAPLGASDHCVRSYSASTGEEDVVFEDCEFTGYPSYILYTQRANRSWNSITIRNCYFYNNKRSAVYINNESGDTQSCDALTIENSTFANFADAYDVIYYNAPDAEHTTTLNVNYCTFYGHSKRAIYWQKSENLAVSNCIFAQPSEITYKSVECVAGTINNCLSNNTAGYSSAATLTDNITGDPLFVDAANLDLHLGEGSPALAAGTEGSNLGDPRWWPAAPVPPTPQPTIVVDAEIARGTVNSYDDVTINGKKSIKMGKSGAGGNMTITVGAGATSLSFYAAAWNNEGNQKVTITAPEGVTVDPAEITISANANLSGNGKAFTVQPESDYKFTVAITGASADAVLTLASAKRAFVWSATYEAPAPAVIKPVIAGETSFYGETEVTITCATEGAAIYYTLDGTEPTSASTQYTAAFNLNASATVKAIAILGSDVSEIAEKNFTKNPSFDSFEALIAAGVADKTLVEVSFANLVIDSFYVSKSNELFVNKGIYFTINGVAYEIYKGSAVIDESWEIGGKVSGTIRGEWQHYVNEQKGIDIWEVIPSASDWTWAALTYAAPTPVVPVQYCALATGHQNNPEFGDPNGRILLTIKKGEGNNIIVAIKNNNEAGNPKTGLNYLWVNAQGATAVARYGDGTHDEADVEEVSVVVEFNEAKETYNFINIHWAYSGWTGEWAIDGLDVAASELCPGTDPVVGEKKYYLVGSMNNWTPGLTDVFGQNPGAEGEYMAKATLAVGDEFKVIGITSGVLNPDTTWYPGGTNNNYIVDADHAGAAKNIYFRPDGQGGEGWHHGVIFVEPNPAPQDALKAVSDSTTWNFSKLTQNTESSLYSSSKEGILLSASTNPSITDEIIYANYDSLWTIAADFDGEAIAFTGEYPIRKDQYCMNGKLRIKTTVAGNIYVKFSDTGTSAGDNPTRRYLMVNGDSTEYWTSRPKKNDDDYESRLNVETGAIHVPAGDVIITGSQAICVYYVTFVPDAAPIVNYYVAGSMNGWKADENYMLTPNNESLYEGEFTFAANDAFKVIGYDGSNTTWYPGGTNNDYKITEAGDYKITFNPAGNVEGWHEGYFNVVMKEAPIDTIPTTAPAAPTAADDDVLAIYCGKYTNNLNYVLSGWAGGFEDLMIDSTRVGYRRTMTWECIIDPAATNDPHDVSGYKKLHFDIWVNAPAKVKFSAEDVAGESVCKDGPVVDLVAGWNSFDYATAEWPKAYDFKTFKCFTISDFQTPEGASAEGNPMAFANIYFYEKEAQGFENIDASVKAVKVLYNGQILILKNNKVYTVTGQPVNMK